MFVEFVHFPHILQCWFTVSEVGKRMWSKYYTNCVLSTNDIRILMSSSWKFNVSPQRNCLEHVCFRFFIFFIIWHLTEWHYFVTYMLHDTHCNKNKYDIIELIGRLLSNVTFFFRDCYFFRCCCVVEWTGWLQAYLF